MLDMLLVVGFVVVITLLAIVAYELNKLFHKQIVVPEQKERIVPAISVFDANKDVTTVCPIPLGSISCVHDWDIITEQTLEVHHQQKYILVCHCTRCGLMDKTIQMTDKAPPPPTLPSPPKSECHHQWVKEKSVSLDSAFEQMTKGRNHGYVTKKDNKEVILDVNNAPSWMFKKTYVCIRVCQKCGDIDKIVANNFESDNNDDEDSFVDLRDRE